MLVLGIDLFIFFDDIDFKVVVGFPFRLAYFDHVDLLGEDGVTDVVSEKFFADGFVLFALVHEGT